MTTVVINDLATDQRHVILFNRPDDFQRADAYWDNEHPLLMDLQHTDFFIGRKRWADLNPQHFRFLLMNNLSKVAALNTEEQDDPENAVMSSLTFLLSALIKCLEQRTESTIELMRLNRLAEHEVLYDFSASVNLHLHDKVPPRKGLRVIVDNG